MDAPIYRIFGVERLFQLFDVQKLALVKPSAWDDPFENFILKSKARLENGELAEFAYANDLYGQCWSFKEESDAMWRIYSANQYGVKVKTTPRKLREALAGSVPYSDISAFIGKVRYHTDAQLRGMLNDRARMQRKVFDGAGQGLAETLLFKRTAFEHEQEVRLIYSKNDGRESQDIFLFPFDPFSNIEEVVFDPRMDNRLVEIYSNHIRSLGFKGKIQKSTLYEIPNLEVQV